MKKFFINKDTEELLIFFTGWGCDEYEFEHIKTNTDTLLLFDYTDLDLDFDFSKYKEINLIAFSAGVFCASVFNFENIKLNKKIAIDGNPYLFDEKLGLSKKMQNLLYNITEENADDFAKKYLVKTEEEFKLFHHSKRSIDSCKKEFGCLKQMYKDLKPCIRNIYDSAIMGEDDKIFNLSEQKQYYGNKLKIITNARHNLFFRVKSYQDFFIDAEIKE